MTGTAALIGRQRGKIILIALLDIIQNKRGVLIELQIVDDRDNWSVQLVESPCRHFEVGGHYFM